MISDGEKNCLSERYNGLNSTKSDSYDKKINYNKNLFYNYNKTTKSNDLFNFGSYNTNRNTKKFSGLSKKVKKNFLLN